MVRSNRRPGWRVFFRHSIGMLGVGKADFTHGNLKVFVNLALNVNPGGVGEDGRVSSNGFEFGGVVNILNKVSSVVRALL